MKLIKSFEIFEGSDSIYGGATLLPDPQLSIRELVNSMVETIGDSLVDIFDEYNINEHKVGEIWAEYTFDKVDMYWKYRFFRDGVNKEYLDIYFHGKRTMDTINTIEDAIYGVKKMIEGRIDNGIAIEVNYDHDYIYIRIPDLSPTNKRKVIVK